MIREDDLEALLGAAATDIDVRPAPAEELARAGLRGLRRRRLIGGVAGVVAVAAVAVGVPVTLASRQPAVSPAPPGPGACVAHVPTAVLPVWARSGFTDPSPRIAYLRSDKGNIVAILFAQPLTAPPSADHNNKVLWVARPARSGTDRPGPLRIEARLLDGTATAVRTVSGGPGPSIINLPKPGCWHLTLHWSGRTDSLDLDYAPG